MRGSDTLILFSLMVGWILLFLLRWRAGKAFRHIMLPLVEADAQYFMQLMQHLMQHSSDRPENGRLEQAWERLPVWVGQRGFDSRLRPGYEFFVLRWQEVGDVLFSLRYLARSLEQKPLPAIFQTELAAVVSVIQSLFAGLMTGLRLEPVDDIPDESVECFVTLQKRIQKEMPPHADWQEETSHWLTLSDLVCALEDLHWLLLRMRETLLLSQGKTSQAVQGDWIPRGNMSRLPTLPTSHRTVSDGIETGYPAQN